MSKKNEFAITAKEIKPIPSGHHEGEIVALKRRTEPYDYLSVIIQFDAKEGLAEGQTIKWDATYTVSTNSKLGKFLRLFVDWKDGDDLDLEEVLVGKRVGFDTAPDPKNPDFQKVVDDSIEVLG